MPRVKELHKNYIEDRLSEILLKLVSDSELNQKDIAEEIGISKQAFNRKIHSGNMSAKELIITLQSLNADQKTYERIARL